MIECYLKVGESMLVELAEKYYKQGYNCAEAILLAGNEEYGLKLDDNAIHTFAGFGGGFHCGDLCGALVGGYGVIGAKYIETKAHDSANICSYSNKLMCNFEKHLGARKCMEIKPNFYDKEQKCLFTVKAGAKALQEVIAEIEESRT